MPLDENRVWQVDQRINDRGVAVDLKLAMGCQRIDAAQRVALLQQMQRLTGLENPNSRDQMLAWLNENGAPLPDLTAGTLREYMASAPLTPHITTDVIEMRQQTAKSSSKKFQSILDYAGIDGRARGLLQYYGASQTGRWSGRGFQPQNLPRGSVKPSDAMVEDAKSGDYDWFNMMHGPDVQGALGSLVRSCLVSALGTRLVVADYSAIEARVLAWLAEEEWVLEEFRGDGLIYEATAVQMYGCKDKHSVTKEQRQNAKGCVLGAGFAGGKNAVLNFGVSEDVAEKVVRDWRFANKKIVEFWNRVEVAYKSALQNPGKKFEAGRLAYRADDFGLWCRLPSGRKIVYPGARINGADVQFNAPQCPDKKLWVGLAVENFVQSIARDLLADALIRCESYHLDVVLHVHDEIVVESNQPEQHYKDLVHIMSTPPDWADGLPLNAEGYIAERYKK